MSLTEHAIYERKWKKFPELAKLLDEKQLSANWTGPTSVSDNIFNQMARYFEIIALVQDNKNDVERALIENGSPVRRDLTELSHALTRVSEQFAEASKLSSRLAHRETEMKDTAAEVQVSIESSAKDAATPLNKLILKAVKAFDLSQHHEAIHVDPNDLIDAGFPANFLLPLISTFQSTEGYQYYCRGKPVDEMIGISHLTLIYAIAEHVGVPSGTGSGFTGSGFAMRANIDAIHNILSKQEAKESEG